MNTLLPAFEFTEEVETAGLGALYFAYQKSLDRQVAVKIFPPALGEDAGCRQSFERVANAVAELKHPNLIGIFYSGSVEGIPYLVMEFVPGKSLARSAGGKAVDFGQALSLMEGICDGLACAHAKGIVHGNLDPSNILLNRKAEPKIGNFGFKRPDESVPSPYAAPEILDGSATATMRSDVYSVAAIFRELLTGSPRGSEAPLLPALPNYGEEIASLLKQATQPDPGRRMPDVRAFHEALIKAAAGGKPKPVRPEAAKASYIPPPGKKPPSVTQVGLDRRLVFKLLIIVVLLFGIHLAWENLKSSRAAREKANREILAKEAAKKEEALAEATQKIARKPTGTRTDTPRETLAPGLSEQPETPEESLERLRARLLSGKRSEMPAGTLHLGESDYLLVSERMGWADAALFAESHGAHLAIPGEGADAEWLASEVAKTGAAWIGVGRGGAESWVTVAGAAWDPGAEPKGTGQFLAVNESGTVRAESGNTVLPFIIQWHADGSNPGTINARLAATGASRDHAEPVFPPGTVKFGDRHFLYVPRPVAWQEAGEMAGTAGAHLMVVSAEKEAGFLLKLSGGLNAPDGIWLGGSLDGDHWRWITGEPWTAAEWAEGADGGSDGYSLVVRPGKGWDSRDSGESASGFIIEWSGDAKAATTHATEATASGAEAADLLAKAKEVILAAEGNRREALAANVKKFAWDLDVFVRGLGSSGKASWEPEVDLLKTCVKDDRLLADEARAQGIRISPEMSKIAEYTAKKQGEIDTKFAGTVTAIRDSFVAKMTTIRDSAIQSGQTKAAKSADEAIAAAKDLGSWLELFGMELPR